LWEGRCRQVVVAVAVVESARRKVKSVRYEHFPRR
jgi:hypothetical protein